MALHHSCHSCGLIVILDECLAPVLPFSAKLFRIFNEAQKQRRHAGFIAAIKVPAAIELLNKNGWSSRSGTNIEDRPPGRHQSINLARHDSAKSGWFLRHKSYMALRQTCSKILQANVARKETFPIPRSWQNSINSLRARPPPAKTKRKSGRSANCSITARMVATSCANPRFPE